MNVVDLDIVILATLLKAATCKCIPYYCVIMQAIVIHCMLLVTSFIIIDAA